MSKWIFTTKNKGDVEIEWTDDDTMIARTVGTPSEVIGSITFMHIEGLDDRDEGHYLVTNMYLDGRNHSGEYTRQGIGREMIIEAPLPVTFHRQDGNRRDDGGHLTGDGPGFATKMVEQGHAFWEADDE
jgi:hypothetical protein